MDPFSIMLTCFALMLMVVILTPFYKMFHFTLRSMIKSTKKTFKEIHG